MKEILLGINKEAIIEAGRKWIPVVCDGSPYVLGADILDEMKNCTICDTLVDICDIEEHSKLHKQEISYMKNLQGIALGPGSGHIEMNMPKKLSRAIVCKNRPTCVSDPFRISPY